jgi:hypothetical protein
MSVMHRRTAAVTQVALIGAGVLLLVVATGAAAWSASALAKATPPAASCGCSLATSLPLGGSAGNLAVLLLASTIVGSVLGRGLAVAIKTARFSRAQQRRPRSAKLAQVVAAAGLSDVVDEVSSARPDVFCGGWLKPRIFVSSSAVNLLNQAELRAVLMHEQYHLTHRHPLLTLVVDAVTFPLRVIPGLRHVNRELQTALELAADESVLDQMSGPAALGQALLKLLPQPSSTPATLPAVTFFATTDRRIDQLLGVAAVGLARRRLLGFIGIGVGLATLLAALTVSVAAPQAKAGELTIGQCREVHRTCAAPRPTIRTWMSTDVQLVSAQ